MQTCPSLPLTTSTQQFLCMIENKEEEKKQQDEEGKKGESVVTIPEFLLQVIVLFFLFLCNF